MWWEVGGGGTTVSGLSEPPCWCTDGRGGAWEGLRAGGGLFWLGRGGAGVGRPGIRAVGFRSAGPGGEGGPRSGSAPGLGWAEAKASVLHACSAGSFPTALCGRDDKHFT